MDPGAPAANARHRSASSLRRRGTDSEAEAVRSRTTRAAVERARVRTPGNKGGTTRRPPRPLGRRGRVVLGGLPMSPLSTQRRFLLGEAEMPTHYYNISADLPVPLPPPLHPATRDPVGPDALA